MTTKPIISLGCAFWDTIFRVATIPSRGKVLPDRMVQAASGMATAAAIAIARLGHPARLWSRIGDDPVGDLLLANLAAEEIDTAGVRRLTGGRTWISTILVDAAGERLVVPYPDRTLDPDPAWLPLGEVVDAAAVMVDMRWPEGAEALLRQARQDRVPAILDADVAPVDDLQRLLPLADHLLFSEPALELVAGGSPEEALRWIAAETRAAICAVTLGERGALVMERGTEDVSYIPSIPIRAVDTLNAGDVWHGAYAFGLTRGWNAIDRVRLANVAAAMKCEVFGGRAGSPRLEAALTRMKAEGLGAPAEP